MSECKCATIKEAVQAFMKCSCSQVYGPTQWAGLQERPKSDAGDETDRFLKENSDLMDDLQKHDAGEVKEMDWDNFKVRAEQGAFGLLKFIELDAILKLRADLEKEKDFARLAVEECKAKEADLATCKVALEIIEKDQWILLRKDLDTIKQIAREALAKVGKNV